MQSRYDNPTLYRENVYKSWKIMSYITAHVDSDFFIAHLEPNPGVGYDCLTLISQDEVDGLRVRFMLNRNGVNSNILKRVWERCDRDGSDAVAEELIKVSRLHRSDKVMTSTASTFCAEVVAWIDEHRNEDFYVGPFAWYGVCPHLLDLPRVNYTESDWPVPDHGPELVMGINGVEKVRLIQGQIAG